MENSIETFSQEVKSVWAYVGVVKEGTKFPTLVMPEGIPSGPGIYRILAPATRCCYVGEGEKLNTRLKKYQNAKYVKGAPKAWTDRTVQGWIAEGLKYQESEFKVWCCNEASIKSPEAGWVPLDLNEKYFRALIESITIAREPNFEYINKQYKKYLKTK